MKSTGHSAAAILDSIEHGALRLNDFPSLLLWTAKYGSPLVRAEITRRVLPYAFGLTSGVRKNKPIPSWLRVVFEANALPVANNRDEASQGATYALDNPICEFTVKSLAEVGEVSRRVVNSDKGERKKLRLDNIDSVIVWLAEHANAHVRANLLKELLPVLMGLKPRDEGHSRRLWESLDDGLFHESKDGVKGEKIRRKAGITSLKRRKSARHNGLSGKPGTK